MNRPRRLAAALLAILALGGCARAPDQPAPNPALWEVSGPHGEHGYLFGTIHALPDGIRWHTPKLDAAFAKADALAVEVRGLDSPRAMNAIFERLAHSPGLPPLADRVPADKRALVERMVAAQGLSDKDFADVETWAAALTLGSAAEQGDSANGVDRALLADAKAKRVIELEGVEPQLRIFDALPEREQATLLVAVSQEAEAGRAAQKRQRDDWLTGNVDALLREGDRSLLADPELRRTLLTRRTAAWAERIDRLLAQGGTLFVAVGTAHVIGPDGLAALLAERGYQVTRVE
jgi:uncharacterized protein YbaP (TraB family)